MKHTPGPHTVEYAEHLGSPAYAIRAADGDLIAVGLLRGDADLFAAAPALLSILRDWLQVGNNMADRKAIRDRARAAIALAIKEGR